MTPHLRIARPVRDPGRTAEMYRFGLGLRIAGQFADHDGFDGIMLQADGAAWHFEFTHARRHPVDPAPTVEDLVVLYVPSVQEWEAACARMTAAGFRQVASFNPCWDQRGRTFEDADGYRVVIERDSWKGGEEAPA